MTNDVAKLFLDYSDRKLVQMVGSMTSCLERLSDEQVWHRGAEHENAVGNLVLHLCGNTRQWIMHGVGGAPDVRVRELEFSTRGGLGKAELLKMFAETVAEARSVLASLSHERLQEKTDPQKMGMVSVLDAIYQVVGHVQLHVGQVTVLTKQMVGTDLDLSIPRPR
jgi:uncharacterized damage-inducible protein DinB